MNSTEKFNACSVDKDGTLIIKKLTTRLFRAFREFVGNDPVAKRPRKKPAPVQTMTRPMPVPPTASIVSPMTANSSHTVVFVDDIEAFPYHAAVRESQGDPTSFCVLIDVLVTDRDDAMRAMAMRFSSSTSQQESLCAAEYAYALGYHEVGAFFTGRMTNPQPAVSPSNLSPATSMRLLQPLDDFPYICVVEESRGDLRECELLCEVVDGEDYTLGARIQVEVVRETAEEVSWPPAQYASHLGYVEIVKYLLKEKCRSMGMTAKTQLLQQTHRKQLAAT